MIEHELDPWIVLLERDEQPQPALWQIATSEAPALILFSTATKAQQYAEALDEESYRATQPTRVMLVSLFVECYKQGIRVAVLDPDATTAKRVFDLRQVLKAARHDLKFEV